jgi:hypothetical protein
VLLYGAAELNAMGSEGFYGLLSRKYKPDLQIRCDLLQMFGREAKKFLETKSKEELE